MLYKRSSELFKQAKEVIPGGVNSPVRAFKSVGGSPIFASKAKGAYVYDEDGNRFIDFISSWGPMILGHAHPNVINAISKTAKKGTSFGMPTSLETDLAKLSLSMVPAMEKIRFVNSGTEACMSAVRLARGYTKKDKIIKFSGCYHGHSDSFLIEAGSGVVTFGAPNSPGVTNGTAKDTLIASYNDLDSVKALFENNVNQIAAIIIEPIAGNMGCVIPKDGFIQGLRNLCNENNSLLIFDEVMTGYRLAKGGAQELLGVEADIVTYGKVIGGGLPVGAFSSKNIIMKELSPTGSIYQAGTLSGNPLAMSAGLATLTELN
ncbi:MAG: glutamate-1-semialdehyde 2,1-aminomutase, partial [Flavobacteriaceae bacterium]|nr:glutamate-1-semialdehyde 2,1-aminomutase [Flavobacteriaceae bacterium]